MNTLPTEHGGSSLSIDPRQYRISNTRTDHNLTNNVRGDSNTNVGNVSHSYNTINVGVDEEPLRIQAWLSPLEPDLRHRAVSNRRLDGIGDWVLQKNEFKSWRKSEGGLIDPTLVCYGGQGVGKTFIRYIIFLGPVVERGKFWTAHHLHIFPCALNQEPDYQVLLHTRPLNAVARSLA